MATTKRKHDPIIKVFVSSTYQDLIPYRQKVSDAIQRLQQVYVGMEIFGSESGAPLNESVKNVKDCALFVLVVGVRYGSIIEGQSVSITQIEYETAVACRIPTLVYIIDDDQPISPKYIDYENIEKLNQFKKELKKKHVISTFTTPEDLEAKVLSDIQRELSKAEKAGDIPVDEVNHSNIPSGEEALDIFRRFILRPMRFDRQEIILPVTIVNGFSGWRLNERIISALGMTIGDTISCDINVADFNSTRTQVLSDSLKKISLYAEGINADWLESTITHLHQTINVWVRLRAVMVKGLVEGKRDEDTLYVCVVVIGIADK